MSDEQYTPTGEEVRLAHVDRRCFVDGINRFEVKTDEEYGAEFDRFLARVRRDAAREALDGLAEWAALRVSEAITDKGADDWRRTRFAVVAHRDTHYPEQED